MDTKNTFSPFDQGNSSDSCPREMGGAFLLHKREEAKKNFNSTQVITYPGKIETYEGRIKILDTQGGVICDELLKDVRLDFVPTRNKADVLTTIIKTNFDDTEDGLNTMQFVDVSAEKSNPITFAIWDPTIASYSFSMAGTACGRNYTLKSQLNVQLPNITFDPALSLCPQVSYSLKDNLIDINDINPIYSNKNGCGNVYNVSSPYPFQYKFLQIYSNSTGIVKSLNGSSLETLSSVPPALWCIQNSTSSSCENFPNQTSPLFNQTASNIIAQDFAEFNFFAAPYFSDSCTPEPDQLIQAQSYTYTSEGDDYLLMKGGGDTDLWVPARKSIIKMGNLTGICDNSQDNPCGVGLGKGNASYVHSWNTTSSSSDIRFVEDTQWLSNATAPAWNTTTHNTKGAVYVTTYMLADGEIPTPEKISWYACPRKAKVMGVSLKSLEDEGLQSKGLFYLVGEETFGSQGSGYQILRPYLGLPSVLSMKAALLITNPYSNSQWFHDEPLILQSLDTPENKAPAFLNKAEFLSSKSSFSFNNGTLVNNTFVVTPHQNQQMKAILYGKAEGQNDTFSQPFYIHPIDPLRGSPSYNSSVTGFQYLADKSLVQGAGFHIGLDIQADSMEKPGISVEYGLLYLFKEGSVAANSGSNSYTVYDMENTLAYTPPFGDMSGVQSMGNVTYEDSGPRNFSAQIQVDFPSVFTVPQYEKQCNEEGDPNTVDQYQFSAVDLSTSVMVRYNNSKSLGNWVPTGWGYQVKILNGSTANDVYELKCSTENLNKGGCGIGMSSFSNPFEVRGNQITSMTSVLLHLEDLAYNNSATHVADSQIWIGRELTPSPGMWSMCPNPDYRFIELPSDDLEMELLQNDYVL